MFTLFKSREISCGKYVRKIGPIHIAELGLTADRQAGRWQAGGRQVVDEIQVNLEIFKNHCTSKVSTFCFV